jgi:hypothetical protein
MRWRAIDQSLARDIAKRFPQDTVVQSVWLSTIRAQIEKDRKDSIHSIAFLQGTAPYELGMLSPIATNSCCIQCTSAQRLT